MIQRDDAEFALRVLEATTIDIINAEPPTNSAVAARAHQIRSARAMAHATVSLWMQQRIQIAAMTPRDLAAPINDGATTDVSPSP